MTTDEAIYALNRIKQYSEAFDETWDKVCEFFHAHPESPLFDAFGKMESAALDMFANASGIHPDAVSWFVYDNRWGASKLEADGTPIDSVETFVRFEMGD